MIFMNYFYFDSQYHSSLIPSFLECASIAHRHNYVKSKMWFNWKFEENPFGKTILACAEEEGKIVGCVAYGMQPFILNNTIYNGVISFENFVHPNYQGQGVFSNLIKLAEKKALELDIDFMLVFPNKNSVRGYLKNNWLKLESPEYWINFKNILNILKIKNLKNVFVPNKSNLSSISTPISFEQQKHQENLYSLINLEYLDWRFFRYPVSNYKILDTSEFYSILRMGRRGVLNEAQVLFVNKKGNKKNNINEFLKACRNKIEYDILSFSISNNHPFKKGLKNNLFIKVPNRTNICFKILNESKISEDILRSIYINAINYHTY